MRLTEATNNSMLQQELQLAPAAPLSPSWLMRPSDGSHRQLTMRDAAPCSAVAGTALPEPSSTSPPSASSASTCKPWNACSQDDSDAQGMTLAHASPRYRWTKAASVASNELVRGGVHDTCSGVSLAARFQDWHSSSEAVELQ